MIEFNADLVVPIDPQRNIADVLADRARKTPDLPLFGIPDGDGWRDKTAREFEEEVTALAKGFVAAGVRPGDKVGFLARTTYEWSLVDFALFYAGAIMVPVYETSSPAQIQWILSDSGAASLMVESAERYERFAEVSDQLPLVATVWRMDEGALATLVEQGAGVDDAEIERRRRLANGSDIATIIYTSGSTGRPKGCVLTHSNFVDLAQNAGSAALREVVSQPGASTLMFITTAHVFARFMSIFYVHWGIKTGHEPNTKNLVKALGSFKPTVLLAVPRVFEKVYNSAAQKTESEGKGAIFRRAAKIGIEHARRVQEGEKVGVVLGLQFKLYDKLVFGKLRELMGGRVSYAVSGSAPLGPHLGYFFRGLGVKILEGYGLTETTAPASVNVPARIKVGTVGPALPGVGIRIADDGEIQVRGINVFREYWRNPEATEAAFDGDWFRTGDLGALDDDGYLRITGRKKEIIVTAGGKNVAPQILEDPIRANPIVGQVVVVGDKKPFISALVTLDPEMLPAWLATHGESSDLTLEQAVHSPAVHAEVQKAIDEANALVSRAESIRTFRILPTEWTEATGHLTPKLSIKRTEILRDFADDVEGIYSEPKDMTSTVAIG